MNKQIETKMTMDEETFRALKMLSNERRGTMEELVIRAINSFAYLDAVQKKGGTILVEDKNHSLEKLVI
ncbi:MAG TPA: hypothetical protein VM577_04935 [Anaerovoracaceae bacterium]|nr:hypothetical protein [Anaerovoracaceae bacterium]